MYLEYFGPMGCGKIFLNDDATKEEIAEKLLIAATTEPGNGSGRVFKRKEGNENGNSIKSE